MKSPRTRASDTTVNRKSAQGRAQVSNAGTKRVAYVASLVSPRSTQHKNTATARRRARVDAGHARLSSSAATSAASQVHDSERIVTQRTTFLDVLQGVALPCAAQATLLARVQSNHAMVTAKDKRAPPGCQGLGFWLLHSRRWHWCSHLLHL